ncbi:MAG TPA: papain-like cysteine protease family protein, partial [Candidatus Gracilibacteria bacterium]|nr:papain-like cysteine protease family protein [Candidatus Gracilibacteria bacterium]
GKRVIALFGATHYVVITGIDENNIYFNNPALEPKQESLSHGDFFRRWREIFDSTEAIIATPQR